jgi:hypothetical protein
MLSYSGGPGNSFGEIVPLRVTTVGSHLRHCEFAALGEMTIKTRSNSERMSAIQHLSRCGGAMIHRSTFILQPCSSRPRRSHPTILFGSGIDKTRL